MANLINDEWMDIPSPDDEWMDISDIDPIPSLGLPQEAMRDIADPTGIARREDKKGTTIDRLFGASMRGWMRLGGALLDMPKHVVSQVKILPMANISGMILQEKDPERKKQLIKRMGEIEGFYNRTSKELGQTAKLHRQGQTVIEKNHPEWVSEPPESFIDLLTNPEKLAVSIAESVPILLSAGVMTAAGQPNIGVMMMYASEGQEAYDIAIQNRESEEDAETAYMVYGTVSAALENMQLQGIIKIGKGMFRQVANRTAQKVARKGLGSLTKDIIKVAATEALEEMAQGTWGEVTAKLVYDKTISSSLGEFIDSRAQEGLIGAVMGIIPGVGGAVTGGIVRGAPTEPTVTPSVEMTLKGRTIETPDWITMRTGVAQEWAEYNLPENWQDLWRRWRTRLSMPKLVNQMKDAGLKEGIDFRVTWREKTHWLPPPGADLSKIPLMQLRAIVDGEGIKLRNDKGARLDRNILEQRLEEMIKKYAPAEVIAPEQVAKETSPINVYRGTQTGKIFTDETALKMEQTEEGTRLTDKETGEEVILDPEASTSGIIKQEPTLKAVNQRNDKELLIRGHEMPKLLGLDEVARKELMVEITNKDSMKKMSNAEKNLFVSVLEEQAEAAGIDYELPVIHRAIETLEKQVKPSIEIREGWRGLIDKFKSGLSSAYLQLQRTERFLEDLDGETDGVLHENIWKPVKNSDEIRTQNTNAGIEEFTRQIENTVENPELFFGEKEQITDDLNLTQSEQMGVYTLAQNEHGRRYLNEGMNISNENIVTVVNHMNSQTKALGDWLMEQYNNQWPLITRIAEQVGIDLKTLRQELFYSPIMRSDVDILEQVDFLDLLTDGFAKESFKPEQKFLEKRKKRAVGKIELDAGVIYLNNVRRIESFKAMAPVAKKIGTILRNKQFKKSLNTATNDQGAKLLNTWLRDSIKGYSPGATGWFGKQITILRRNAIVYAIGYNIPTVFRQTLSLNNAVAVDKLMRKYVPLNLIEATRNYKALKAEVEGKSTLVQARDYERDLRQRWDRSSLKKKILRKDPFDKRATRWIKWMDKHTVIVAWKSLYDTAKEKKMGEKEAIAYADKWIGRTQPMANAKDLPQFFRDGELAKIVSAFQNQINNNFNFYAHDIIGAKKRGEISNAEVAHRVMFSYIMPAILFGMIGRGSLPRSWEQLATDLITYPIATLMLVGRLINRMIMGWDNSSTIVEAGPEELIKTGKAIRKGDIRGMITGAAKTIGAFSGRVPAQTFRTLSGAEDLLTGTTKDPRRLIYSQWALDQGKKPEPERFIKRGKRRVQRRAVPRR